MQKLNYFVDGNILIVEVEEFKIKYRKEIHIDYGSCGGFGSMREMEEEIENRENSTHYLYLEGTDWKKIIHGYVDYDFYLKNDGDKKILLMRFSFTGIGNSQIQKPKRTEEIILGEVLIEGDELKLITEDGKVLIEKRES